MFKVQEKLVWRGRYLVRDLGRGLFHLGLIKVPSQGTAILLAEYRKGPEIIKYLPGKMLIEEQIFSLCLPSGFLFNTPCLLTRSRPASITLLLGCSCIFKSSLIEHWHIWLLSLASKPPNQVKKLFSPQYCKWKVSACKKKLKISKNSFCKKEHQQEHKVEHAKCSERQHQLHFI